jgi:hypothetical protein
MTMMGFCRSKGLIKLNAPSQTLVDDPLAGPQGTGMRGDFVHHN